jgi:glutamine amidotransferase
VRFAQPDCPLYRGIADGSYFYYVHSFFPQPADDAIVATRTEYGQTFASSVWRDNVFATQFHPEKSQSAGLQLLRNFVELTAAR